MSASPRSAGTLAAAQLDSVPGPGTHSDPDSGPDSVSRPAGPLTVMIVDDQAIVRIGFQALLDTQPDMSVVATAGDGREAVRIATSMTPDVVLMDVRMPIMGGIEATRALQRLPTPPKVLILTTFDLDEYVYDALRAGASGFLLKDATPDQIVDAVRVVGAGEALLAPERHPPPDHRVRRPQPAPDATAAGRSHPSRAGGLRPARDRAGQRRDRGAAAPGGADSEDPRQLGALQARAA